MIQTSLQISDAICPDCNKVITRTESVKDSEFGFVHLKCFENPKLDWMPCKPYDLYIYRIFYQRSSGRLTKNE